MVPTAARQLVSQKGIYAFIAQKLFNGKIFNSKKKLNKNIILDHSLVLCHFFWINNSMNVFKTKQIQLNSMAAASLNIEGSNCYFTFFHRISQFYNWLQPISRLKMSFQYIREKQKWQNWRKNENMSHSRFVYAVLRKISTTNKTKIGFSNVKEKEKEKQR